MVGISGSGKVSAVLVIMAGWQLSLYVAPRYLYSSFIVWANLSDALGLRSKMQPSKSLNWTWKSVSASGSGIGLFQGLLNLYFLVLEDFPLFPSVRFFDSLLSDGRDGFDLAITTPFLDISCSYVEFTFCVCHNSYGLIETEIFIKYLLSSILDR